jgi:hypothetical protein
VLDPTSALPAFSSYTDADTVADVAALPWFVTSADVTSVALDALSRPNERSLPPSLVR